MNKIKRGAFILSFAIISILTSCSDWLNVKPSNQVAAEDLFSTEEGFKSALSGVYTIMADPSAYGREMTFGVVDLLGKNWTIVETFSQYYSISNYDFEDTDSKTLVEGIWETSFFAIANINDLLAFIETNKSVFSSEQVYSVIKGEALALRAYIHLDMLRLFGYYTFGGDITDSAMLPYVTEYTRNTSVSVTNKVYAEQLMSDINEAIELLKQDPIYSKVSIDDTYFNNRHFHINYYAAVALKARAALYTNDLATAQAAAQEVVDAQGDKGLFPWITADAISATNEDDRDRTFSTEHIFSLNVRRLGEYIDGYFVSPLSYTGLQLLNGRDVVFEGSTTDYRYYFVNNENYSTKLNQPEDGDASMLMRMPMLRISEMYYILAETTNNVDYIEMVRSNRGLETTIPTGQEILVSLETEFGKEFIAEGQKFYFHKRNNHSQIGTVDDVKYVLHMPDDEIDFAGRPRPQE